MRIAGLARSSTVDFPGLISAVIFSPGCNFDCFFCHNRTLLDGEQTLLDNSEILAFLERRRHLLDGVVFSGGEPTLQPDLAAMIGEVRRLGYRIKLDTNGARPQVLRDLLAAGALDYVAIDFKAPWPRYADICGCGPDDVEAVRASFALLAEHEVWPGLDWEVRTTVIPQLGEQELNEMAHSLPPAPHYFLQRYNKPAAHRAADRFRLEAPALTPARLVLLAEALRVCQPNIQIR